MRFCGVLCFMLALSAIAAWSEEATVKRSDVVFMGAVPAEIYEAYNATMVSWGGGAGNDSPDAVAQFRDRVKTAHDRGVRYCAGLAFRTAFARMIDFDPNYMDSVCRDLDGKPILVPWLWDHKHKGNPAYWFCTNAPGYRKYLLEQARLAMTTGVEGLHIDDYNGTAGTEWQGGCFCPHCMAAFRDYLRQRVPAARLQECGVTSLAGFDYGQYLKERGITLKEFRQRVGSDLPLGPEFLTFQYTAAANWVGEVRRYAEKLAGKPLMLSVNSSAGDPKALVIAPQLTYFCGEVDHEAATRALPHKAIFVYKIGDALGRPIVCTASGQDWAYIMANKLPGLVRTWIAQSYAFGNQLMAPHRQWAYTQEKGTHWYQSSPADYAPLYQFVHQNTALFDGYEAIAPVGVLYSNAALRQGNYAARDACMALAQENIPFRLVIAGDDWLPNRITEKGLSGLKALVVPEPVLLDNAKQAILRASGVRVLTWPDGKDELPALASLVQVNGAEKVTVVPRAPQDDRKKPFVCHLVNGNYDGSIDRMIPQRDFRVSLAQPLFGKARVTRAVLYAPGQEPRPLALTRTRDGVRFTVPELDLWAVVKLER